MSKPDNVKITRLALIGVGLIGGSFARGLRAAGLVDTVVGCARSAETLQQALSLKVLDEAELDPAKAVIGADLVLLAVPVMSSAQIFSAIKANLEPSAIISDVGSVKVQVIESARANLGNNISRFVPGHPIAGTEHSGVAASFAELFQDKHVILTPLPGVTDVDAVEKMSALWRVLGADVLEMDAVEHDRLLAMTSHLPHVLAYTLVRQLAQHSRADELFELAAAGFYDFTRIASSDPLMWRDICLANKDAIVDALTDFRGHIDAMLDVIEKNDGERLFEKFQQSKHARDRGMAGKKP